MSDSLPPRPTEGRHLQRFTGGTIPCDCDKPADHWWNGMPFMRPADLPLLLDALDSLDIENEPDAGRKILLTDLRARLAAAQ